jgi:hypothetical protein
MAGSHALPAHECRSDCPNLNEMAEASSAVQKYLPFSIPIINYTSNIFEYSSSEC